MERDAIVTICHEFKERFSPDFANELTLMAATAIMADIKARLRIMFENNVGYNTAVLVYGDTVQHQVIKQIYDEVKAEKEEKERIAKEKRRREKELQEVVMSDAQRAKMEARIEELREEYPGVMGQYFLNAFREGYESNFTKGKLLEVFLCVIDATKEAGKSEEFAIEKIAKSYEMTEDDVRHILSLACND